MMTRNVEAILTDAENSLEEAKAVWEKIEASAKSVLQIYPEEFYD